MTATSAILVLKKPFNFPDISQGVDSLGVIGEYHAVICRPRPCRSQEAKSIDDSLVEILSVMVDSSPALSFCIARDNVLFWIWANTESERDLQSVANAFGFKNGCIDVRDYDIGESVGSADIAVVSVLVQCAPAAATETDMYTVPAGKTAKTNSIMACNRDSGSAVFWVSVSKGGGATADGDYLAYSVAINGNSVGGVSIEGIGIGLSEGDVVRVKSDTGNVSFSSPVEEYA